MKHYKRGQLAGRGSRMILSIGTILVLLVGILATFRPAPAAAVDFADPAFRSTWERTDQPVAGHLAVRSWFWGPAPGTLKQEPYAEGSGGTRLVQYFDKSRMEINNPNGDRSQPFFVTNGLLTIELMSGKIQVGNTQYQDSYPAYISMAGDPGDTKAPTYAAFAAVANTPLGDHKAADRTGHPVGNTIDVRGRVFSDTTGLPVVAYAHFEPTTGHNVAAPFWQFLTQSGVVIEGGQPQTAALNTPWFYASGLPISEAYWGKFTVNNQVKDVLIQAFERRVLTYVPTNPAGFQVEMGNIGQHYYNWRYNGAGQPKARPTPAPTSTPAPPAPTNTPIRVGGGPVTLNGAGATFPAPIYTKWFQYYSANVATNVTFNYQPIGSGAGITQITNKTVDFAGSDAPMSDSQIAAAPGIIHIPTVAGAVVLVYNVDGVASGLVLDGNTVAKIFLGDITSWNDPEIAALNPGVSLPAQDIVVVHRSDGSGTTNIFTDYLSHTSAAWQTTVGKGTSVNWPVGLGGRGNPGVAGLVKQTAGAIGYVELAYAKQNQIAYAKMVNKAGATVDATLDSIAAAVNGAVSTVPDDLRVSIVNSPDPGAWPIAGFTYILLYTDQPDPDKGSALVNFLWWDLHDSTAASQARDLLYLPVPSSLLAKVELRLRLVNYQGHQLAP
ncbi:MAG TPA: phosphate ABC transporter substrate-binding protein PstS [Chloroflexia bacterium]|nr:phosphate ABC transporter substrate-binding protein PstS [Chloroflexia bacterium]